MALENMRLQKWREMLSDWPTCVHAFCFVFERRMHFMYLKMQVGE